MVIKMTRGITKLFLTLMVLAVSLPLWAQNTINSARVWPSPDSTRVVFDLDEKQDFIFLKDLLIYFKDKNNYHFKTKDIIEAVRKKKIILSNNKVKRNLIK